MKIKTLLVVSFALFIALVLLGILAFLVMPFREFLSVQPYIEEAFFQLTPCNKFPTLEKVEYTIKQKEYLLKVIEKYSQGTAIEEMKRCPGKAILKIYYGTDFDKAKIDEVTGISYGDDFLEIPYRLHNV